MVWEDAEDIRQRLPSRDQDPKERKRILGILAQRRYRQRKKQRKDPSDVFEPSAGTDNGESSAPAALSLLPKSSSTFRSEIGSAQTAQQPQGLEAGRPDESTWLEGSDELESLFASQPLDTIQTPWTSMVDTDVGFGMTLGSDFMDSSRSLQSSNTNTTFQDSAFISMPCLDLVRAQITILGTLLNTLGLPFPKMDTIWNPFAQSPFESVAEIDPRAIGDGSSLPANYRPTLAQLKIAHHPVFDILPWPSVRERMIGVMTLPIACRPKRAQEDKPNVAMQIKFDLFDPSGGVRIHGTDPMDAQNWEVGQVFFENWWWALDSSIVKRSNEFRRARGLDDLRFKKP